MRIVLALILLAFSSPAQAPNKSSAPAADSFVFVAGGDMIGPYRATDDIDDPAFKRTIALFQHADLGFANQEGAIFDLATFSGYPSAETGGGYPVAPVAVAKDYRDMGITLVSKANNHGIDWGSEGLVATLKSLSDAGIVEAGAGIGDVEARAPGYVQTPKGKAALVSTASTFPPAAVAGPSITRRGLTSRPRPGISAIHIRRIRLLPEDQLAELRRIAGPVAFKAGERGDEIRIGDEYFRASKIGGTTIEADPADVAAVLDSIRQARKNAQFVVFAIHAHETAGNEDDMAPVDFEPMALHRADEVPSPDDPRPADFERVLFHQAIDAGADVVMRTGPHVINGVEIYHEKPIFYGLGSLFFVFGPRRGFTAPSGAQKTFPEEWYEAVIPKSRFSNGELEEVRLYPIVIESSSAPTDGFPHLAAGAQAQRILARLITRSRMFGTSVSVEGDVGVIRPVEASQ
jgi:poly-gamma-glutamate capsule biosynthesis protein CapA/YwtB (metallophosphatase superfamily)